MPLSVNYITYAMIYITFREVRIKLNDKKSECADYKEVGERQNR